MEPLREFIKSGKAVWGTCAGLILLADRVDAQCLGGQDTIGGLDITAHRNFFGNQVCACCALVLFDPPFLFPLGP